MRFRGCSILQGHAVSIGSEMSGSVFDTVFEDLEFGGKETHGYGAGSLRVKSARGRGVRRPVFPAGPCPQPPGRSPPVPAPADAGFLRGCRGWSTGFPSGTSGGRR